MPEIHTEFDILFIFPVTVYPVDVCFAKSCPRIVVCINGQEIKKHEAKETEIELKSEQQQLLNEGTGYCLVFAEPRLFYCHNNLCD